MAMHKGDIDRPKAKDIMLGVLFSKNVDYDKNGRRFVPYEKDKIRFADASIRSLVKPLRILKVKEHRTYYRSTFSKLESSPV